MKAELQFAAHWLNNLVYNQCICQHELLDISKKASPATTPIEDIVQPGVFIKDAYNKIIALILKIKIL